MHTRFVFKNGVNEDVDGDGSNGSGVREGNRESGGSGCKQVPKNVDISPSVGFSRRFGVLTHVTDRNSRIRLGDSGPEKAVHQGEIRETGRVQWLDISECG